MIHNAEKFNNKIMKKFFFLIKIIVAYLFIISNGISIESNYYIEGINLFHNLISKLFFSMYHILKLLYKKSKFL